MRPRSALLAGVLVLVGVAVTLAPVAGVAVDGQGATAGTVAQTDNGTDGPAFGVAISSFMQASTAEANGSVDSGMWAAEFNDSADKEREVRSRVGKLERRLDRLEARMDRLEQRRGELPRGVYLAQASRLTAEIESLETAINETDSAAASAGVNDTRLDRLQAAAANASGQQIARIARNLTVVTPPGSPAARGSPGDRGAPGLVGGNGTSVGGPGDRGPPAENGTDTGPPGDRDGPVTNGTETAAGGPDVGPSSDREPGQPGSDGSAEARGTDAGDDGDQTTESDDDDVPEAGVSGGGQSDDDSGADGPPGR